jgi:hypothetical protein
MNLIVIEKYMNNSKVVSGRQQATSRNIKGLKCTGARYINLSNVYGSCM